MQKVPNSWINKDRDIDKERFSKEVDHNSQFTHPVNIMRLIENFKKYQNSIMLYNFYIQKTENKFL